MIMSMLNVCGENLENLYNKKCRSCAHWGYAIRKLLTFPENILLEKYYVANSYSFYRLSQVVFASG